MLQILFVDDEPEVLEGLRDRLRVRRREWRMRFASSGAQALSELSRTPAHVVVSDLRMPGMDGSALLHEVARQARHTVRIVLSGYAEEALAGSAAQVAHSVLSKPCALEELDAAITSGLAATGEPGAHVPLALLPDRYRRVPPL